jgi:hypothetical protein
MFPFGLGTWVKIGAAIALVLALVFAWYKVDHWCNAACRDERLQKEEVTMQYKKAVAEADAKQKTLEQGLAQMNKRWENALAEKDAQTALAAKNRQERIKANEDLRNLKLSADIIRLFNESANQGRSDSKEPPATKQGDDGTSNPPKASTSTGVDLFGVVDENNANHWSCVRKVDAWQTFWLDLVDVYNQADPATQ